MRPERARARSPHAANWYAAQDPWDGVYGLPLRLADTTPGGSTSRPVWFAQLGAAATLPWLAGLDLHAGARPLRGTRRQRARPSLGLPPRGSADHLRRPDRDQAGRLTGAGVVSAVRAGRTRLSFHLYNTEDDVDLVLGALAPT